MTAIAITCEKLDETFALIKGANTLDPETRLFLQNQSVIYMAYLDDLAEGRLTAREGHRDDMADLINEFCSMIQGELQGKTTRGNA